VRHDIGMDPLFDDLCRCRDDLRFHLTDEQSPPEALQALILDALSKIDEAIEVGKLQYGWEEPIGTIYAPIDTKLSRD
jgi:hypothetical protein